MTATYSILIPLIVAPSPPTGNSIMVLIWYPLSVLILLIVAACDRWRKSVYPDPGGRIYLSTRSPQICRPSRNR
jgi:hypothetical protein